MILDTIIEHTRTTLEKKLTADPDLSIIKTKVDTVKRVHKIEQHLCPRAQSALHIIQEAQGIGLRLYVVPLNLDVNHIAPGVQLVPKF